MFISRLISFKRIFSLIQECKSRGYNYICKTMDHVIILEEALDILLDKNKDFYYTCGIGAQRCIEKNNEWA